VAIRALSSVQKPVDQDFVNFAFALLNNSKSFDLTTIMHSQPSFYSPYYRTADKSLLYENNSINVIRWRKKTNLGKLLDQNSWNVRVASKSTSIYSCLSSLLVEMSLPHHSLRGWTQHCYEVTSLLSNRQHQPYITVVNRASSTPETAHDTRGVFSKCSI